MPVLHIAVLLQLTRTGIAATLTEEPNSY